MDKKKKKTGYILLWGIVLSFIFHVSTLVFIKFSAPEFVLNNKNKEENRIKIVLRENKKTQKPKQIVSAKEKKVNEKKDPKAKFLSKNNQMFDRQTTARNTGAFKEAGRGVKTAKKSRPPVTSKEIAKQSNSTLKKTPTKRKKKKISFSDLAVQTKTPPQTKPKNSFKTKAASLGLENGIKNKSGLSANNDFVEDIPLGDMTNLNTVEYKYYGFYHRIKQKLEQYWGNTIQKKAMALWKSGRRLPASANKITSLEITIDNKGNIVKINIKGSSGVKELDDAAIESFNRAGPFPNPPIGMMKNGLAKIQWGFVVKG